LSATSFIGAARRRSQTNLRAASLGLCVTAGELLFLAVWIFRIVDKGSMLPRTDVPLFLALGLAVMLFAGLTVYQTRAQAEARYLKKLQHDWDGELDHFGLESALDPMKNDADNRRIGNHLSRTIRNLCWAVVESIRPNRRRYLGKRRNKRRRLL
jgi:hypothetical protein